MLSFTAGHPTAGSATTGQPRRRRPLTAQRGGWNCGLRFSRKAANALLRVGDHRRGRTSARPRRRRRCPGRGRSARRSPACRGPSTPMLPRVARVIRSQVASSSCSAGTTLLTRPQSAAVRGVDGVAGEGHLQRPLATDVAGHRHQRRVAEQPALAAGDGERRLLRGDGEVARGDELAARPRWPARAPWPPPAGGSPGPRPSSRCRSGTAAGPRTGPRPACRRSCDRPRTPARWRRG